MGRRIRILPGVDRAEFDGEPVGLQRYGNYHLDRRIFAVHLFHCTESGIKAIANTQRSLTPGDRSGPDDRISSDMTELPRDRVRSPWQLGRAIFLGRLATSIHARPGGPLRGVSRYR